MTIRISYYREITLTSRFEVDLSAPASRLKLPNALCTLLQIIFKMHPQVRLVSKKIHNTKYYMKTLQLSK